MGLIEFNDLDRTAALAAVRPALDVQRWTEEIVDGRPYRTIDEVLDVARDAARPLTDQDIDQALSHHPKIGERAESTSTEANLSRTEQAGLKGSTDSVADDVARGNLEYEARFGHVFLIRAAGRSYPEILSELQRRLHNSPQDERVEVAEQLREIAVLRIEGMLS